MNIIKAIKAWWKPEVKEVKSSRTRGPRYWLCCGTLDAEHSEERLGICYEREVGLGHHCNYGDAQEQKEYCDKMRRNNG